MPPKVSVLLSDDEDEVMVMPICKPKAPAKPKKPTGYNFPCFPGQRPPTPLRSFVIDSVTGKIKLAHAV